MSDRRSWTLVRTSGPGSGIAIPGEGIRDPRTRTQDRSWTLSRTRSGPQLLRSVPCPGSARILTREPGQRELRDGDPGPSY
jgi:hypothetical protein